MKLGLPLVRGIRDKLLISFSLLVALLAAFGFIGFISRLEHQAMRAAVAKAHAIRNMTEYSLRAALDFGDLAGVHEVLDGASRTPEVQYLYVSDSVGNRVASRGDASLPGPTVASGDGYVTGDGGLFVTSTDVMRGGRRVGSLTVGVSLADLRIEVDNARQVGALAGALVLAVGIVLVYAISMLVTRPLTAVAHSMKQVAAGDLTHRTSKSADVEVAELLDAFNLMVDSLAGAQQDLSQINQQLEARVDERTRELREAVSEQRRAQDALSASESQARATSETLRSLIDVAPQAIIAVDLNWRVTRWNRAAVALFGWTEGEVVGKPIPYIPEDELATFSDRQRVIAESHALIPAEATRVRKDGSRVNVLVSASVVRDRAQQPAGYIAIVTDITERKSLEEQLRQSQKMEAIGRLAGGVAHDFNNLLTVIASYAAMLLEQKQNQEERDDIEQIAAAALRASALTRQLLTFSRREIVQLQPLGLNSIVQDMGPMLRRLLRENIQLTTALTGSDDTIVADHTQIEQLIMNLVVNASDAMPDGGVLTVETKSAVVDEWHPREHAGVIPGRYLMLTVADTGIGMDQATITRIFEPFFTTKGAGKGTGLGLATSYAVVAQLGGRILVTSEVGKGTTFRVYLPHAPEDRWLPAAELAQESTEERASAHATVLLVEDEDGVRRVVRRGLEQSGFTVIEAADGESGIAMASKHAGQIDVLVTDLMMPGINGREVADLLSRDMPGLRIIFMSGYADDTVDRQGLVGEGRLFLPKPFTGYELAKAIRELLQAGHRE